MKYFLMLMLALFGHLYAANADVHTYADPQGFRGSMTTTQRDALYLKKDGMVIYNTTVPSFQLYSGGSWSNVGGGAAGANTTLSNLGVTAINADLIPASDGSKSLGNASTAYSYLYVRNLKSTNGEITVRDDMVPAVNNTNALGTASRRWSSVASNVFTGANALFDTNSGLTVPSGVGTVSGMYSSVSTGVFTLSSAAADANATSTLYLETGNKTGGTGNSGDIKLTTGTSLGGVRGAVIANARVFRFPTGTADPASATEGDAYENTSTHKLRVYNGTIWADAN